MSITDHLPTAGSRTEPPLGQLAEMLLQSCLSAGERPVDVARLRVELSLRRWEVSRRDLEDAMAWADDAYMRQRELQGP